ncbi:hypothetical protein, partial [Prevotella sp.]|uniref:hypothetical protein n=1 Tax=Prevotella sp. TaxID=59823 RepID=UPI00307FF8E7
MYLSSYATNRYFIPNWGNIMIKKTTLFIYCPIVVHVVPFIVQVVPFVVHVVPFIVQVVRLVI